MVRFPEPIKIQNKNYNDNTHINKMNIKIISHYNQ
jgi:hypothetical protein